MRFIEFRRHSTKQGSGNTNLSVEGIELARRVGERELRGMKFSCLFESPMKRSQDTLIEFAKSAGDFPNVSPELFPPHMEVSESEDGLRLWNGVCHRAEQMGNDMVQTALAEEPELTHLISKRAATSFKKWIKNVPDGARVLVVGHSPFLELIALGLLGTILSQLQPCQGFRIVENDGQFEMNNWEAFHLKTKNRPPQPLLVKAVTMTDARGAALDLGAGALNDTKYLLSQGFQHITILDKTRLPDEEIAVLLQDKVEYVTSTFENFEYPEKRYDIVNAQYALPFNPPSTFNVVFFQVKNSLKSGGLFVGQLFGVNDEWNSTMRDMSFHNRAQVEKLLSDMDILELDEEEKDQKLVIGDIKHWHLFHIIARKR